MTTFYNHQRAIADAVGILRGDGYEHTAARLEEAGRWMVAVIEDSEARLSGALEKSSERDEAVRDRQLAGEDLRSALVERDHYRWVLEIIANGRFGDVHYLKQQAQAALLEVKP